MSDEMTTHRIAPVSYSAIARYLLGNHSAEELPQALADMFEALVEGEREAAKERTSKLELELHNTNVYATRLKRERDEAREALFGYGVLLLEESEDTADGVRVLGEKAATYKAALEAYIEAEEVSSYGMEESQDIGATARKALGIPGCDLSEAHQWNDPGRHAPTGRMVEGKWLCRYHDPERIRQNAEIGLDPFGYPLPTQEADL